ncbi:exosortase/archaeosortase family protein [Desulfoluna spongiiphila]|uniref:Exosortase n=1 Tax=Desulfoluna spongiiphila TaxID=419481 RepID=A0A1G5BYK6_9BACT|nr:exosortase/archaeosortase family protein [Desulfoluna spongiiphila]SCX95176.1 exosortase [Desulfoluna spongiiphila]
MTSHLSSMRTFLHRAISARPQAVGCAHGVLLAASFGFLYLGTLAELTSDWNTNPNFSHGYLVPLISGFLIWRRKEQLKALPITPSHLGLAVFGGGLLLFFVGTIGAELFVMRCSMLVTLAGIILFCLGRQWAKALAVPVGYLVFMIPLPSIIWNKIAFPLQLMAASGAAHALPLFGVSVFREGNVLHLASTTLEVVDACSGLRSLMALLALGAAFAFISPLAPWKKWILFLSSVPVAVLVNVLRLTVTGMMAVYISPETAHGTMHDLSGMVAFGAAIFFLFVINQCLET